MVHDIEPTKNAEPPTRLEIPGAVFRFERRARYYLVSAITIGATILLLLFFAGYVFFFARDIEGTVNTAEMLQRLQFEKAGLEETERLLRVELAGVTEEEKVGQRTLVDALLVAREHIRAKATLAMLQERERLLIEQSYINESGRPESKEELTVQIANIRPLVENLTKAVSQTQHRFNLGEVTRTDLAQAQRLLSEAKRELIVAEEQFKRAPNAKEIRKKHGDVNLANLISVNLVRFGGLAVILFLVSILVPVYRYNSRLAAFYLARADALIIYGDKGVEKLAALATLLTPTYEYEQGPPTPVDALSTLLKEGIGLAKKA